MPRRWAFRSLLFAGLVALAGPLAGQPGGAPDKVTYRTADGKVVTEVAETKESAAGVQLILGGKAKAVVSPADVVRIEYGQLPGLPIADLNPALAAEGNRDAAKAQQAFAEALKKAGPNASEKTKRYLSFREAYWAAEVADQKTGDEFKSEAPKAADRLAAVARVTRKSWEVWPTARAAARIYSELGDYAKAAAILGELAAVPDLPADLKHDARLAEVAAMVRGGNGLSAQGELDKLEKEKDFPTAGPLRERLAVLKAAARLPVQSGTEPPKPDPAAAGRLEQAINQAKDPAARQVGQNFLGDYLAATGQTRDAMWAYLWADVVYNQDKSEQLYAVNRLAALFDRMGDADRAAQFRERLPRIRG